MSANPIGVQTLLKEGGTVNLAGGLYATNCGDRIQVGSDSIFYGGAKAIREQAVKVKKTMEDAGMLLGNVKHVIYGIYVIPLAEGGCEFEEEVEEEDEYED